jgi:hypothetical protein
MLMWSVVHLPCALIRMAASTMSSPARGVRAGKGGGGGVGARARARVRVRVRVQVWGRARCTCDARELPATRRCAAPTPQQRQALRATHTPRAQQPRPPLTVPGLERLQQLQPAAGGRHVHAHLGALTGGGRRLRACVRVCACARVRVGGGGAARGVARVTFTPSAAQSVAHGRLGARVACWGPGGGGRQGRRARAARASSRRRACMRAARAAPGRCPAPGQSPWRAARRQRGCPGAPGVEQRVGAAAGCGGVVEGRGLRALV